jgi:hypothetical protein
MALNLAPYPCILVLEQSNTSQGTDGPQPSRTFGVISNKHSNLSGNSPATPPADRLITSTSGKEDHMGTPSSWPLPCKRAVLLTATLVVLASYFALCLALMRLSVLFLH